MKIIVMDSMNVRIEVLNVPDHIVREDIEQFLTEHDYSLNNISWMAAPIDFVPVLFHEYDTDKENGEEIHATRSGRLKDFSIHDSVQEVKHREQEELATALRLHGDMVDDGYEWHFEEEKPIVAGYIFDDPRDIIIDAARVDADGNLLLLGRDKEELETQHEIVVSDIFGGHLEYITECIR